MAEQVSPPALRLCRMSSPSVEAGAFVPDLGLATPSSLHFLLRCPGTAAFGPVRRLLRGRYWSGKVLCDGSCCSGSGLGVSFPQPHPDPADQTGTLTRIRPGFLIVRHWAILLLQQLQGHTPSQSNDGSASSARVTGRQFHRSFISSELWRQTWPQVIIQSYDVRMISAQVRRSDHCDRFMNELDKNTPLRIEPFSWLTAGCPQHFGHHSAPERVPTDDPG